MLHRVVASFQKFLKVHQGSLKISLSLPFTPLSFIQYTNAYPLVTSTALSCGISQGRPSRGRRLTSGSRDQLFRTYLGAAVRSSRFHTPPPTFSASLPLVVPSVGIPNRALVSLYQCVP